MAISDYALDVANNLSRQGFLLARPAVSNVEDFSDNDQFKILGQQQDLDVSISPVQTEEGSKGRQKNIALDVEISAALQQTSDTELKAIKPLLKGLIDVVVAPSREKAENLEGLEERDGSGDPLNDEYLAALEAAEEDGVSAYDVLASIEPTIDFMGEGSDLAFTVSYRMQPEDLNSSRAKELQ